MQTLTVRYIVAARAIFTECVKLIAEKKEVAVKIAGSRKVKKAVHIGEYEYSGLSCELTGNWKVKGELALLLQVERKVAVARKVSRRYVQAILILRKTEVKEEGWHEGLAWTSLARGTRRSHTSSSDTSGPSRSDEQMVEWAQYTQGHGRTENKPVRARIGIRHSY